MYIKRQQHIVVIGGGTGTHTVLSGLKKYPEDILKISAVVTVADSGGSSGRLRDEFGILPVGDFRMALVALSPDTETGAVLRKLFSHRFTKGNGLTGHSFGNLFLAAMTELFGSEERAIAETARILKVRGNIFPVSNAQNLTLVAHYENGATLRTESMVDDPPDGHDRTSRIADIFLEPAASVADGARDAIESAALLVVGPGDLYTSIIPNLAVRGVPEALRSSKAPLAYIVNLITKHGQTGGYTARDHLAEIVKYAGRTPDYVIMNKTPLPRDILASYAEESAYPVGDDLSGEGVIRCDLLASETVVKVSGDMLKRSLIRHDPEKLARVITALL